MTIQYGTDQTLHEEVLKQINSKPEPENLTHADTVALKDLDDAFTQAQVDNLVKELEEWALRALHKAIVYIRFADLEFCC